MSTVQIRDLVLGGGRAAICIPVAQSRREEILASAKAAVQGSVDMVEWRGDFFPRIMEKELVVELLGELREVLGKIPLLFTIRTAEEGGQRGFSIEEYCLINRAAIESGYIDVLDVELFQGDRVVRELIQKAREFGVKVIASNHDFQKTPSRAEMKKRLVKMQELGADVAKIAVMPVTGADVIELLAVTEEMAHREEGGPVITMSMGKKGVISRIGAEVFGSALTFGTMDRASAPGQMPVEELARILETIRNYS